MPDYIDIHSHLNFPDLYKDKDDVLLRMKEKKVWTISVGTDRKSSEKNLEFLNYDGVFTTVGLHPDDDLGEEKFAYDDYKKMAEHKKVVAIGECGLDYFRINSEDSEKKKKQKQIFEAQIDLAQKLHKPLMIHCRPGKGGDAYQDVYDILKSTGGVSGNTHFFAGDIETAKKFLSIGFSLSFTGVITFVRDYDPVIQYASLNMIMSETDAPFVAPVPHRGKTNEPSFVPLVVAKIAEIRGEDIAAVKGALVANAIRVFGLK
ncbi:TatD family hydrolase [Candidatus Parcubacteria bacterium]|nr:TatD family hydrolase [Candidatus Parcubacteria bacterium]